MYDTPRTLKRYIVDRCEVATQSGLAKGVVLVLTTLDGRELPVVMTRADAKMMAHQLTLAANELQAESTD